ncbi:hypothetical protein EG329_008286 [Mollisiaceae sp. DMI_Dod_QoI]|nr:hypothetical protein EG329_008286 [Helotiales sp. DMI_Dod_QoI]
MVESMDRFTWCMTLIVATLDAAVDTRMVRVVLQRLMIKILEDRTDAGSEELLVNGLKKHLEGWRSAACVRGISLEARAVWKRSLKQGKHLPGNIPESDSSEIEHVYCLAEISENIGLGDQLKSSRDIRSDCDESQMLLILDTSHVPVYDIVLSNISKLELRRGMRIPLDSMEESVSLWGGDTMRGNARRDIFTSGMRASDGVKLVVALKSQALYAMDEDLLDVYYIVKKDSNADLPRMEKDVYRLLDVFFLASTPGTAAGLRKLVESWPSDSISKIGWWLQDLHADRDTDDELNSLDTATTRDLTDLIVFVLGYYYALLKPLLITTELSEQEAIGSWGYNDIQVLRVLRQFKLSADADYEGRFSRHAVLRLQ